MKKGLIFGGIALVIGVGAYLWYKNTLKKIKEETAPDKAPDNSAIVYDKKGVVINNTVVGRESHSVGDATFTRTDAWKNNLPFGA
jgi:hypothetical protein